MSRKKLLVIDTDMGVDDAAAVILAARHPGAEIVALTLVDGNVPLAQTVRSTKVVLDILGRPEIPVYAGEDAGGAADLAL